MRGRAVVVRALGAELSDAVEHLALVGGVGLHTSDEVRDQLIAALEFRIDVAPRLGHVVAQGDEAVVLRDDIAEEDQEDDTTEDEDDFHERLTLE